MAVVVFLFPLLTSSTRPMESLGRGVVAVRSSDTKVLVSWRLLGRDPDDIAFNIYRSTDGTAAVKRDTEALAAGTIYVDTSADLAKANRYFVRPLFDGTEHADSDSFTLTADHAEEPVVRIPIHSGGPIK